MKKKLIEVALPLEAINKESAREKSIRHGHPSTLHLWWARRPLAACRAVLFAQLVDDPSAHPEEFPTEEAQQKERERLFKIIEELVKWENVNNETVLEQARTEIRKSAGPDGPPPLLDPFAGGGSIPLEAQRLGLEAHASDLNPVAVLINKALIEIPPRFANRPPVHPNQKKELIKREWRGAEGLAEDVRYYGQWMRDEAERRIGHLYPKAEITEEILHDRPDLRAQGLKPGDKLTVIAWLWARTVKCPNPACGAEMPLVRSFWLATKKGKEAWVEPVVERDATPPRVEFRVRGAGGRGARGQGAGDKRQGGPSEGTVNRRGVSCPCCQTSSPLSYVRSEAQAGRMGARMMAIVAEGAKARVYLPPNDEHNTIARSTQPPWKPEEKVTTPSHDVDRLPMYGMYTWGDAFTPRQLVALTTFSGLVGEVQGRVLQDAWVGGLPNDGASLATGGRGAVAYADAAVAYLGLTVSKTTVFHNTLARWRAGDNKSAPAFGRQAISMVWDYTEVNPFAGAGGDFEGVVDGTASTLLKLPTNSATSPASVAQANAAAEITLIERVALSTDPPYYDNIGYADLSDFFYVWLRHSLGSTYPDLFNTLLVPKAEELIASPYRFGGDREAACQFFEQGLGAVFSRLRAAAHPDYPVTVYYAFKQTEATEEDDAINPESQLASTGWETMLEGLIRAVFQVTGTWPMRTEGSGRLIARSTNALASSIVLVCRPRPDDAPLTTRRDFLNALKRELPAALRDLQKGNVAPVDLAQASIGPGMGIYSRYRRVLEADGSAMTVRTALALINQALDEYLAEQESEYDADTRWALAWYEQYGFKEGPYGDAETLSTAKNTSVGGMARDGLVEARAGKVRLLRREELPTDWDPGQDRRLTVWETVQHLIRTMQDEGEAAAAELLRQVGGLGEAARALAYRLYTLCERKGWAQEALPYNGLVVGWREVQKLAQKSEPRQMELGM